VRQSLAVIPRAIYETLRISAPTVVDNVLGTLTIETCNQRLKSWAERLIKQAGVVIHTEGKEHIDPQQIYVLMSNHQSLYDIPVAYCAFGRPLRMVAKKELFDVPIWGGAMHAAGFVMVDRSNRRQATESLRAAGALIKRNDVSLWIAPEGTRSRSGELGTFKRGGFHLAKQAGIPILPLAISGTREILPAKTMFVRTGRVVHVTFGKPIDPSTLSVPAAVEHVQNFIAQALQRDSGTADETSDAALLHGSVTSR